MRLSHLRNGTAKFNELLGRVVESLADAAETPRWKAGSPNAPKWSGALKGDENRNRS